MTENDYLLILPCTVKNFIEQLDFTVQCPDCRSYDCAVGEKIGLCKTCGMEFSLMRPDVMKKKLKAI